MITVYGEFDAMALRVHDGWVQYGPEAPGKDQLRKADVVIGFRSDDGSVHVAKNRHGRTGRVEGFGFGPE